MSSEGHGCFVEKKVWLSFMGKETDCFDDLFKLFTNLACGESRQHAAAYHEAPCLSTNVWYIKRCLLLVACETCTNCIWINIPQRRQKLSMPPCLGQVLLI
jgi:hypothetical protein